MKGRVVTNRNELIEALASLRAQREIPKHLQDLLGKLKSLQVVNAVASLPSLETARQLPNLDLVSTEYTPLRAQHVMSPTRTVLGADTSAKPTPSAAISADSGTSIETDQRTRRTRKDPFAEALNEALSSNPDASPIKVKRWIVERYKLDIQFRDSDQKFVWFATNPEPNGERKEMEMNWKAFVARIGRWKKAQK
jgi:hypothetical protein